jgi:predicted metal-dependent HD superfamily phosphohydrolase
MDLVNKYTLIVKEFYSEPHRKFHSWNHIESGFSLLENVKKVSVEQKIAWLYHDIFYKPGSSDNESLSASKAVKDINENNDTNMIDTNIVSIIILDTKKHIPSIEQSKLVLDIDMSCLALRDYQEFFNLRILAAREFLSYGKDNIVIGTKKFIKETLEQKQIFHSEEFNYMNKIAFSNLERFYNEFENDPKFIELFKKKQKLIF